MKCNCKTLKSLSYADRAKLKKEIVDMNDTFFRENYIKHKKIICNNLLKIFCIALNNSLGLGSVRLEKVLTEVNALCLSEETDYEEFWIKYQNQCKRILGEEKYHRFFKDIKLQFNLD